jgi:hypothetical protein
VICFKRRAARSDIVMVISLPSSSVRGFWRTAVAHVVDELEKCPREVTLVDVNSVIGLFKDRKLWR